MGLDVYLAQCEDRENEIAKQDEALAIVNKLYEVDNYENLSDEKKDEISEKAKEIRASLGLDIYGSSTKIKDVKINSNMFPEHMFKVGYFRSSYNGAGTNSVLKKRIGYDMYDIFGYSEDVYYFVPNWDESLVRVENAISDMNQFLNSEIGKYDSIEVSGMTCAKNENEALEIFKEQLNKKSEYNYSCRNGNFFLAEPITVVGFIQGGDGFFGSKKSFLITKKKETTEKDWYLQALEIMRETIQYVLAQPNKEHYFFKWSA